MTSKSIFMTPFYNPELSYEENYELGPFGTFSVPPASITRNNQDHGKVFGFPVATPFGIPSGPLLNSRYIRAAFRYGFDFCVYKTVRTSAHSSHPLPNVMAVHPQAGLDAEIRDIQADMHFHAQDLSITNSFGVPSLIPDLWQQDMAEALKCAGENQILAASFQGTPGNGLLEDDYALAARLVAETGIPVLEANMSCPNEGTHNLLCFDIDKVERIVHAIRNMVPDHPLIIKLAYFKDDALLDRLIGRIGHLVSGFSVINTLSMRPVSTDGTPALSNNRRESGICGAAIRWAGLEMVSRLAKKREETLSDFTIIGIGGVSTVEDYHLYRNKGADIVMAATATMWNPYLAQSVKHSLAGTDGFMLFPENPALPILAAE